MKTSTEKQALNDVISCVATNAHKQNKTSKAFQLDAVLELIAAMRDNDCLDYAALNNLAVLYKQYLPAIPAKPKTAFQWIYKAVAKADVRHYLNTAYAESHNARVIGCDGKRLHVAPSTLATGYYDKACTEIKEDARYPDVNRVIPKKANIPVDLDDITKYRVHMHIWKKEHTNSIVIREPKTNNDKDEGVFFDLSYIQDALSNPSPVLNARMNQDRAPSLLITFVDGSQAVVMGLIPA